MKYLKEGELVASPKVFLESIFTTLVIYSFGVIDVATFDMTGTYLQT